MAKFMAAAGTLLTMKLFLLILPFIASDRIKYSDDSTVNTMITTLFVLGGIWSIYKGSTLILQLLDQEAAAAEEREREMIRGYLVGAATSGISAAGSMGSGLKSMMGNKFNKQNKNDNNNTDGNEDNRGEK